MKKAASPQRISQTVHMGEADVLEILQRLLRVHGGDAFYAYERNDRWYLGLGVESALSVSPDGSLCTLTTAAGTANFSTGRNLAQAARTFSARHASSGRRVFGHIGFNYAAHVRGQRYAPGRWPLVSLVRPCVDVVIQAGVVEINACSAVELDEITRTLANTAVRDWPAPCPVEPLDHLDAYQDVVRQALAEIEQGVYSKVIASRPVLVRHRIDMISSLVLGRRSNTPARTFAFRNGTCEAMGFSPELVMQFEDGVISTEPLAGTRATSVDVHEDQRHRADLLGDAKEMVEHVLSVRAAVEELEQLCDCGTVAVHDFMSVKRRGSVQHLGSRVSGTLRRDRDAWDALDLLFPSITASGIPKLAAIAAIGRLERAPRELYSGAVLIIEGKQMFEATLALRAAFQDDRRSWLQAGAGIIALSNPYRELMETTEKLRSVAPFIVGDSGVPGGTPPAA